MRNYQLISKRKGKGYTQEKLATLLGCKKTTVSNWENGYSTPSLNDAFIVANVLDCNINDIFSGNDVQESQRKGKPA